MDNHHINEKEPLAEQLKIRALNFSGTKATARFCALMIKLRSKQ